MGKKKNKKKGIEEVKRTNFEGVKKTDYRFTDFFESTLFHNYDLLSLERLSEGEQEYLDGLFQLIRLKIFLDGEWLHRKKWHLNSLNQCESEFQNLPVDALRELIESL
ncbi:MAG: hypothetical protein OXF50_06515 [Caldilineaceae bacterium]|nr:hypothetical protein [Caldilineaceae bacterium]